MKFIVKSILALAILIPATSFAAPAVCKRVVDVSSRAAGALIQYKNAQVQRACASLSCPVSGFIRNPTIIATQGKNPFTLSRATIYSSAGRVISRSGPRQGCASNRGECLGRYKFPTSSTAVRLATQSGGAFVLVSKAGLCIKVPNAGICYNVKSRGTCDGRTL